MSGKPGPRGRGEWMQAGRAFGRGVLFAAVLSGVGVSGLALTSHWNPILPPAGYALLVSLAVRVWMVAPRPQWWERVASTLGALSVLVPVFFLFGRSNPLVAIIAASFIGGIWSNAARRRRPVTDPVPAHKATWAP